MKEKIEQCPSAGLVESTQRCSRHRRKRKWKWAEMAEVGRELLRLLATRWRCAFTFLQLDSARNETSGNSTRSKKSSDNGTVARQMGEGQRQNANANGVRKAGCAGPRGWTKKKKVKCNPFVVRQLDSSVGSCTIW